MSRILVGTASWTDPTLVKDGHFYPPEAKSAEARLRFYAEQFPIVEVDSTYYFPPSEKNAVLWIDRTPKDFTFNIKAYSLLTNHPTKRESLYKDLLEELPEELGDKKNLYREHLPETGRGAGLAAVPRRAHAAPLGGQARRGAVPVPPVVRDRAQEQGLHPRVRRAAEGLPARDRVPSQDVARGAQRRGDALVPGGARSAARLRRHAAGVRLERPADRRGDREGSGAWSGSTAATRRSGARRT